MAYLFDIFERIVGGDLSPSVALNDKDAFLPLLRERHHNVYLLHVYKLTGKRGKLIYKSHKTHCSINPFSKSHKAQQGELFTVLPDEIAEALADTGLNVPSTGEINYQKEGQDYVVKVKEPCYLPGLPVNELKFYYYATLLDDDVMRIVSEMRTAYYGLKTPEKSGHYIQKIQHEIISLCQRLGALIEAKTRTQLYAEPEVFSDDDILRYAFLCLERLQHFLERNYFTELDKNAVVPCGTSLYSAYDVGQRKDKVREALEQSSIDKNLLRIVEEPLEKIATRNLDTEITYRELGYLLLYLTIVYNEVLLLKNTLDEAAVKRILYEVNFNSPDFVRYETQAILDKSRGYDFFKERVEFLYGYLKEINQHTSKLALSYDPRRMSLHEQLNCWLEEEIAYLNKLHRRDEQPKNLPLFGDAGRVKIQSDFSVAQLAFFYKIQAEAGIISNKVQRDVFKHVAESYKTKNAAEISPDSIGSKYYNVDTTTIETVKSRVIEMLNCIKEYGV